MWLEGSSGYHFYTMSGLWPLAEAARNCGLDLYNAKFRAMFDGPLNLSMPNLTLPNFNDSGTVALHGQSDLYELAFARFRNNAYLPLLKDSERHGRLALLFGVTALPPSGPLATAGSRNSPASGYAILQQGTNSDATWLCLKYGPHGGGHGHPDKNSFVLYARGKIVATDAGTHAYGSSLHRDWDKTTLAHNTLVVDETSQAPATGKCLAFGTERGVDYAITDAGPIYKGIKFTRSAAMLTPGIVVFADQIDADAPRTFDIAYHSIGVWEMPDSSSSGANSVSSPSPLEERAGERRPFAHSSPNSMPVEGQGEGSVSSTSGNPKGIASSSPRLRGWPVRHGPSYLGVGASGTYNPERVAPCSSNSGASQPNWRRGPRERLKLALPLKQT
jgi:hypothetical protein